MPYHLTLDDYRPSARLADSGPWTQARFERAALRSGPWTAISTETLDPVDTDETHPQSRDFTVEMPDVGYPGWLRVVFLDGDGNLEPTDPVFVGSAIRPAVAEVANLMPDRTTGTVAGVVGELVGTFDATTRPTATQVDALIDLVLDTVEPRVPAGANGEVQRSARAIVALNTAILVENAYFADQGEVDDTRIAVWERLLEGHTAVLDAAAREDTPGHARAYSVPIISATAAASALVVPSELIP